MRSVAGGLLAILVVAVCVRFVGIGRELPYRIEPDSSLVFQMQRMSGDPTQIQRDHSTGPYPLVLARILSWIPHPEIPARVQGPGDERVHLARSSRPFLLVRIVVALFSVAGVLLCYPFARRYFSKGGALVATWLAGTSLLSILFSGQARPHPVQATLALAALLLALRVREAATWRRILPAALACVAAIGALQNGVFTVLPLLLAILLSRREASRPLVGSLAWCSVVGVATVAVALLVFPGMPRIDSTGIHLGSDETGAHTIHPSLSSLAGLPILVRMLWEFDPLLALFAPVGAGIALAAWRKRRNPDGWILLAYAVPYVGILSLDPNVQERFLLPMIPLLACLAAAPIAFLLRWIGERGGVLASAFAAAVVLGAPAVAAGAFARTAAAPDNYRIAADWIRANLRPEERILTTPGAVLPLLSDGESMSQVLKDQTWTANPWMIYQSLLAPSPDGDSRWKLFVVPAAEWRGGRTLDRARARALIEETRADYVLLEDSVRMHKYYPTEELEKVAAETGDLVYRTVGTIPGPTDGLIFEYSGTRELARRILSAKAFGPGIRIYRLRK